MFQGLRTILPVPQSTSTTTDTGYYHLTDPQFSTLAMTGTGKTPSLYERVRYEPYGTACHRWGGDVDGDGDSDVNDKAVITGLTGVNIRDGGYEGCTECCETLPCCAPHRRHGCTPSVGNGRH